MCRILSWSIILLVWTLSSVTDRWSIIFILLSHFVLCLVFLLSQWNYHAAKLKWPVKHNSTFSFLLCSVLFLLFPCFLDSSFSPFLYSILPFSPLLSSRLNTVILYWSGEASCLSVTEVKEASYFLVYLFNIQSKPPGFPDFMKSNLVA